MHEIFKKYKNVVLFYSGGKDSLTVLLLCKPWWDELTVVFVDTGNQFPEVYEHMELIKRRVPKFVTLHSNVTEWFNKEGFPVDVVPTRHTATGDLLWGNKSFRCCSRFDCCKHNLWDPMQAYFALHRPDCVLRGDRGSERNLGMQDWENVHFEFPIFDWTTEMVHEFLKMDRNELTQERHFLQESSSLDCRCCTAYMNDQKYRIPYLKKHHPEVVEAYVRFYKDYKQAISDEMAKLGDIE